MAGNADFEAYLWLESRAIQENLDEEDDDDFFVSDTVATTIKAHWDQLSNGQQQMLGGAIAELCRRVESGYLNGIHEMPDAAGALDDQTYEEFMDQQCKAIDAWTLIGSQLGVVLRERSQYPDGYDVCGYLETQVETARQQLENRQQALAEFRSAMVRQERTPSARPGAPGPGTASGIPGEDTKTRLARGDLDETWVVGPDLGSGVYGSVTLFLKQDHNGRITDRVAIKVSAVANHMFAEWDKVAKEKPTEVRSMELLQSIPEAKDCIVRLRNWNYINPNKLEFRVLLEYCPYGTVHKLRKRHHPSIPNTLANPTTFIPEPFLWAALENFAILGISMDRGGLSKSSTSRFRIYHHDLKLDNIFLGLNSSDRYAGYPSIKIGDWGISLVLERGKVHYANQYTTQAGFDPYHCWAPEEHVQVLEGQFWKGVWQRSSSKANVWAVGHVMWCIVTGRGMHQCDIRNWQVRQEFAGFSMEARGRYSAKLLNLVMACVAYLPDKRPGFDEILAACRSDSGDAKAKGAQICRGLPDWDPLWKTAAMRLSLDPDVDLWAVGDDLREAFRVNNMDPLKVPKPPKKKARVDAKSSPNTSSTPRARRLGRTSQGPGAVDANGGSSKRSKQSP